MDFTSRRATIQQSLKRIHEKYRANMQPIPERKAAPQWIDRLIALLFPVNADNLISEADILELEMGLRDLLKPIENAIPSADQVIISFFTSVEQIFESLQQDARVMLASDPAAHSAEEVMAAYPGFYAIAAYRFAHELQALKVPVIPRLITEYAHSITGIDIHPGAVIGSGFFIDHGTGVVIGETAVLGNNIKIYQGVTLGALSVSKSLANTKRHPTIEDNVVIYSGTTILGGKTIIGHDSIIGGNVWLTESIPPYSMVYHKSEIRVRSNDDFSEGINFTI